MSWLPDTDDRSGRNHLIISLGNDGKLLLWKWTHDNKKDHDIKQLELLKGFSLKSMSIPQNIRVAKGNVKSYLGGKQPCKQLCNEPCTCMCKYTLQWDLSNQDTL